MKLTEAKPNVTSEVKQIFCITVWTITQIYRYFVYSSLCFFLTVTFVVKLSRSRLQLWRKPLAGGGGFFSGVRPH